MSKIFAMIQNHVTKVITNSGDNCMFLAETYKKRSISIKNECEMGTD